MTGDKSLISHGGESEGRCPSALRMILYSDRQMFLTTDHEKMIKRKVFFWGIVFMSVGAAYAHEPIYGLGPETLPKNLNALEFGTYFFNNSTSYELGYGYGITQNWTVRLDVPAVSTGDDFGLGNIKFRTKYALWRKTDPGVLQRLTAIAAVSLPTANRDIAPDITAYVLGLANGYESRRWYYFSDIGYTFLSTDEPLRPGNRLNYNLVGGIRPVKSGYLKPDLVLLVELNGEWSARSKENGDIIAESGGNTLAIAPGFLLSYRNIMLKGGIQFGIANSIYAQKKQTNGLISLEYHF